jgi:hypothetical protein
MALVLTGNLSLRLTASMAEALDLQSRASSLEVAKTLNIANGVAANQCDLLWSDERSVGASPAAEDLDLAAVLADVFGSTLTFVKLKFLYMEALATNVGNLGVTRPANGVPFLLASGDGFSLPPGAFILMGAPGLAGISNIVPDTGDLLHVANGGAQANSYKIALLGASA